MDDSLAKPRLAGEMFGKMNGIVVTGKFGEADHICIRRSDEWPRELFFRRGGNAAVIRQELESEHAVDRVGEIRMFDGGHRTTPARSKVTNLGEVRLTRFSPRLLARSLFDRARQPISI
jgi:hypothetical protein